MGLVCHRMFNFSLRLLNNLKWVPLPNMYWKSPSSNSHTWSNFMYDGRIVLKLSHIGELIKLTRAAIMKLVCLGQMNCKRRWPSITALIMLCNLPQPWFIFRNSCILVSILAPVLCVLIPLSGVDGAIVSGLLVCWRTPLCHCPNVRLPVKTAFQRLPVFHHNCTLARTTTRVHCSGCIWLWSD